MVSCVVCHKQFEGRTNTKYCSNKCRNRAGQAAKYGLTPEEYGLLTKSGQCAICNRRTRRWHLDHDHDTNLLLGPVCSSCNIHVLAGLRRAEDPIQAAKNAVEFLSNPPAQQLGRTIKVKPAISGKPRRFRKPRRLTRNV